MGEAEAEIEVEGLKPSSSVQDCLTLPYLEAFDNACITNNDLRI